MEKVTHLLARWIGNYTIIFKVVVKLLFNYGANALKGR